MTRLEVSPPRRPEVGDRTARRRVAHALVAIALGLLAAAPAAAQSDRRFLTLASGERGKTYHDLYAPNLIDLLPAFHVRNRNTKGSGENLDLLSEGKAEIGFAQADVYAARLRRDPERYGRLTVIGRLQEECVFVAHRARGPIEKLQDLGQPVGERSAKIAVGPSGGGMTGTWSYMSSLDPSLAGAEVLHTGGALALNQLAIGLLDAVSWVTDPANLNHVMLRAVQQNDDIALLIINDRNLEHALEDGTRIYQIRTFPVTDDRKPDQYRTICTSGVIFAREGANPRLVEAVSQALSLEREKIFAPR